MCLVVLMYSYHLWRRLDWCASTSSARVPSLELVSGRMGCLQELQTQVSFKYPMTGWLGVGGLYLWLGLLMCTGNSDKISAGS